MTLLLGMGISYRPEAEKMMQNYNGQLLLTVEYEGIHRKNMEAAVQWYRKINRTDSRKDPLKNVEIKAYNLNGKYLVVGRGWTESDVGNAMEEFDCLLKMWNLDRMH